jgi:hypothetical protein
MKIVPVNNPAELGQRWYRWYVGTVKEAVEDWKRRHGKEPREVLTFRQYVYIPDDKDDKAEAAAS